MVILKFLFFVFLIGFILMLFILVAFGGTAAFLIKRAFHLMKDRQPQGNSDYVHVNRKGSNADEEIIIDKRNTEKQQKQIFGDDEGEYVEYEEEV